MSASVGRAVAAAPVAPAALLRAVAVVVAADKAVPRVRRAARARAVYPRLAAGMKSTPGVRCTLGVFLLAARWSQSTSTPTGAWSEPLTPGQMNAAVTRFAALGDAST